MSESDSPTPIKRLPGQQLTDEERALAQSRFIKTFERTANVLQASKSAKVHRSTIYEWLEKDEAFSFAYNQAKEVANDVVDAEIDRRGRVGWKKPVFHQGMQCGTVREYSDTLLIFLAKSRMAKYREKTQVDSNITMNATVHSAGELTLNIKNATSEELSALRQLALSMKARER